MDFICDLIRYCHYSCHATAAATALLLLTCDIKRVLVGRHGIAAAASQAIVLLVLVVAARLLLPLLVRRARGDSGALGALRGGVGGRREWG